MRRELLCVFILLWLAIFCSTSLMAQVDPTAVTTGGTLVVTSDPNQVENIPLITATLSRVSDVFKAMSSGNIYAVLVALCNLLVAILKNNWIQGRLAVWSKSNEPWMSKRQKVFLTLVVGVLLVAAFAPKATIFWTVAKGLEVALCSIGTYTVLKHLRRAEISAK